MCSIRVVGCTRDPHHSAMVWVIKPLQQLHAGAFPAAAAANKGQCLAGFYRHVQPIQNLDIGSGGVCELAVDEVNVSLEIILDKNQVEEKFMLITWIMSMTDMVHSRILG